MNIYIYKYINIFIFNVFNLLNIVKYISNKKKNFKYKKYGFVLILNFYFYIFIFLYFYIFIILYFL